MALGKVIFKYIFWEENIYIWIQTSTGSFLWTQSCIKIAQV